MSTEFKSLRKKAKRLLKLKSKYQENFKLKELFLRLSKLKKLCKLTDHLLFQLRFQYPWTELLKNSFQSKEKLRKLFKLLKKLKKSFKSDLNKLEFKRSFKLLKNQLSEKLSEKLRRLFHTWMKLSKKLKLLEKKLFQLTQPSNKSWKFQTLFKKLLQLPMRFQEFTKLKDSMKKSSLFLKSLNCQLIHQLLLKLIKS